MTEYVYRIWQGGIMVAEVGGTILDLVQAEARHYAVQYREEGPIEVKPKRGTPPLPFSSMEITAADRKAGEPC